MYVNSSNVLKDFRLLKIKNTNDLYDFVIGNDSVFINGKSFNLNDNIEALEFMSLYFSSFNFDFKRFCFEKAGFKHYFLVFFDGDEWFYYEPILKDLMGQFVFVNYDELLFFVTRRLNEYFYDDSSYILREVNDSDEMEIFVSDRLSLDKEYDDKPKVQSSFIRDMEQYKNFYLFFMGFFFTIAFLIFIIWISSLFD